MFGYFCHLTGCVAEIVFFLYKTGEAMLDASVRPFLVDVVCRDLTRDLVMMSHEWTEKTELFHNGTMDVCHNLELFPTLEASVQERSARFLIIYRILINIPAAFLGLMCGAWSDHSGRKLPMMLPSVGSVTAVLLYLTSLVVPRHGLALVMAGALAQGIMGKSSVITMAVNSYIVDNTPRDDRTRKLGKLLAMNFFGLFFGSLLSGTLQDLSNLRMTLVVVAVFHGLSVVIVGFFVSDETQCKKITTIDCKKKKEEAKYGLLSLHGLKESLYVLVRPRPHGARLMIVVAFLAMVIHQTCKVGEQDITVLFVQRPPLSWPPSGYGYLLSLDYAIMGGCLLLLLPVMSRGLGMSDVSIIMVGLCCKLVRSVWAGFCQETWMVYTSVGIGAMAGVVTSALRSLLSKSVEDDETGKVFALASSGETLAKLIGSLVFINIYAASLDIWPGLAYACTAAVYVLLLLLMIWLYKEEKILAQVNFIHDFTRELPEKPKKPPIPIIREPGDPPNKSEEKFSLLPLCSSSGDLIDSFIQAKEWNQMPE